MGELETEYGDRADFVVVSAEETAQRQEEIALYGFTDLKHGLVVFSSTGEAVVKLPGHQFGKEQIEAGLLQVLDEED